MDIKLDPELQSLLTKSAKESGQAPSELLDEIVRRHLLEEWFEREVRPAYERAERGETIPFDPEAFRRRLQEKYADEIARAKP